MVITRNAEELAAQLLRLYEDAAYRKKMGDNAYSVVEANRGALAKQLESIKTVYRRIYQGKNQL